MHNAQRDHSEEKETHKSTYHIMGFGLFLNQSGYSDSAVTPT